MEKKINMPSNNKRIAKNTFVLYIRMIVVMMITLYTSRVILHSLGVVDYGLYNVVGGIVVILAFINTSAATSTSRFLTFSLGEKGKSTYNYQSVFSAAFYIHLAIALAIVLLAETVGLWYVNNKLVIPEERVSAAMWVYHISIINVIVSFTQVPYNASIIAHEKMKIYAYVGIYDAVVRLLIAYSLTVAVVDKLILYALLTFCATLSMSLFYRFYCIRSFGKSCTLTITKEKKIYSQLLSFSGWDMIGHICHSLRSQGVNLILNYFFGPAVNAARAVAYQVEYAVYHFVTNFLQATRPVIIKNYAAGEYEQTNKLLFLTGKVAFILLSCFVVPLVIESDTILELWLVNPPDYSSSFLKIVLITGLATSINQTLLIGVHAGGNVKSYNLSLIPRFFFEVPLIILILMLGGIPEWSFWILFAGSVYTIFVSLWAVKNGIVGFSVRDYIFNVIIKNLIIIFIPWGLSFCVHCYFGGTSIIRLLLVGLTYLVVLLPFAFFIVLTYEQRRTVVNFLIKRVKRVK